MHIFKYSPREGTKAAVMKEQVHGEIKTNRSHKLQEVCSTVENNYLNKLLGRNLKVLFEEVVDGCFEGLTEGYLRVSVRTLNNLVNKISDVKIIGVENGRLIGELIQ